MASIQINDIEKRFRFSVPVNNLDDFNTSEIHINQIPWKIQIGKAKIGDRDVINVSLICCYKGAENEKWSIDGGGKIKLVSFKKSEYSIEKIIPISTFNNDVNEADIENFVTDDNLFKDQNGFIDRQILHFDALITVSPLEQQIEAEASLELTSTKFGVVIRDIEKLNEVSSERVNLCGVEWLVKFAKKDKHLAVDLFHNIKKDDFAWSFNVNFIAKLMTFAKQFEPFQLSFKHRFTVIGSQGWGWPTYLEWEKLLDPKNGYCSSSKNLFFEISIDVEPRQSIWKTEIVRLKNDLTSEMECPICYSLFANKEVLSTSCGHLYCAECIRAAIAISPRCPMCNAETLAKNLRIIHLRT